MEGHLAREVVHSAGVHETQRVAHRLGAQDALARDWTDPPVGQGGGHDAARLTGDLYGAELRAGESGSQRTTRVLRSGVGTILRLSTRVVVL